ncbi:hypothetical protein [Tepidimonas sp.]|uniref:hypothetical protein n=1 Tax=Tepidimonas sp. TaxID=2002775 RepID=UPI002FE3A55F
MHTSQVAPDAVHHRDVLWRNYGWLTPAVLLMRKLRFGAKATVISMCFALLTALLAQEIWRAIRQVRL